MGCSTGVQRNKIMRERSEGGIFFLFHYLGKEEGKEAGHCKTEMGRRGARGAVKPSLRSFTLFDLTFFPTSTALFFSLLFVLYTPRLYTDLYTIPL